MTARRRSGAMSISRRALLGLGGATVALPRLARAQRTLPVIGFLHGASADTYAANATAFAEGLSQGGFVEAQNLAIEYRFADARPDRLAVLAADLVHRGVALIVAGGARAATIAAAATATIPIIFVTGVDPVELNLVAKSRSTWWQRHRRNLHHRWAVRRKTRIARSTRPRTERIGYLPRPRRAPARCRPRSKI